MFYNCKKLTGVSINGIDISKITSASNVFTLCTSLNELDLSYYDKDAFANENLINILSGTGDIAYYVKDSYCKELLQNIKPNATIEIKSA